MFQTQYFAKVSLNISSYMSRIRKLFVSKHLSLQHVCTHNIADFHFGPCEFCNQCTEDNRLSVTFFSKISLLLASVLPLFL